MMRIRSGDGEISYQVLGKGPDVVLLHPFPANHEIWLPVAESLSSRYRVILPDLRGHGDSTAGDGPATMAKHADDLRHVLDDAGVGRAVFGGISIGGYVLFEFWRRESDRFAGMILSDTRAGADTDDARAMRMKAAGDVERLGPEQFLDAQPARLLGRTTLMARPDLVERVRVMMRKMTVRGISTVQRGMAMRSDSTPVLASIDVPALLIFGEEDELTTVAQAQAMQRQMPTSTLQVISRAGHYSIFERQEDAAIILRQWLDRLPRW